MSIKAGDAIPGAQLIIEGHAGPSPVDAAEFLSHGSVILFAVPGPFTPTCSAKHLPGFLENHRALKDLGYERIVCMAVNDIFVLQAWAKASGVGDEIIMAADGNGDFSRALGLELDARAFGMGMRSQRFTLVLKDGIVEHVFVDEPGEFRASSAEYLLDRLSA